MQPGHHVLSFTTYNTSCENILTFTDPNNIQNQEIIAMEEARSLLKTITVQQLLKGKRRLIEVSSTASVGDALNNLLAHNILAVAVAAPPGHWIGAGGSMIMESDKETGAARKQYIGIVSTLDILIHLAELKTDASSLLASHVSSIIGHCLEGLTLWSISPHTSVIEAMEPMGKGLHRGLVPLESQMDHVSGLESVESSPGYHMLTQTDLIRFLHKESAKLQPVLSQTVESLGVVKTSIFGVFEDMTLVDTMRCMTQASLTAVAILKISEDNERNQKQLVTAMDKMIVGTFSASDLRGCSADSFQKWATENIINFLKRSRVQCNVLQQVTCCMSSSLEDVIDKALEHKVHRVWVVKEGTADNLVGLVSYTDILRVLRKLLD